MVEINPDCLFIEKINNPIDNFFLVLAIVYNDVKGLIKIHSLINDTHRKATVEEVSFHSGEISGVNVQINKLLLACIYEFINSLKKNRDVLNSAEFHSFLTKTNEKARKSWEDLISIANEEE